MRGSHYIKFSSLLKLVLDLHYKKNYFERSAALVAVLYLRNNNCENRLS